MTPDDWTIISQSLTTARRVCMTSIGQCMDKGSIKYRDEVDRLLEEIAKIDATAARVQAQRDATPATREGHSDILSCPFCGGKGVVSERPDWGVSCENELAGCCDLSHYHKTREAAIEAWNKRQQAPPQGAALPAPDWSSAPDRATHHAFNARGNGVWLRAGTERAPGFLKGVWYQCVTIGYSELRAFDPIATLQPRPVTGSGEEG